MKIRHEAPGAELDWKVQAPLTVETPSGELVRVDSWSLAGLEWPADAPDCPRTGTLSVPFQGVDIRFPVRLNPQPNGSIALEGLSGRQRETLALFYRSLLSGRMASNGELITSLDTPVDLVPMEETEEDRAIRPTPRLPRLLRAVFNMAVYLALAGAVMAVVGNNIFTSLDRIDIQHGRVIAPVSDISVPQAGVVGRVLVTSGQVVPAGAVLFTLRDPETEARLAGAEADLALAQAAQARLQQAGRDLDQARADPDPARRMALAAQLFPRFVPQGDFDAARRNWLVWRDRGPQLAAAHDPLTLIAEALEIETQQLQAQISALQTRRAGLLDLLQAGQITAPEAGQIDQILIRPGQMITPKTPALRVEGQGARVMVGWVSERFAETVYIGMPATAGFNLEGEKQDLLGTVTDIQAGDHPQRPGEFGILITVTAQGLSPQDSRTHLRIGAPVNLEAKRQLLWDTRQWIRGVGAVIWPGQGAHHDRV